MKEKGDEDPSHLHIDGK